MLDIQTQLFDAQDICFGPIDYGKDPEVESGWTHDSDFMRMYTIEPARPMSAAMVKKQYENIEKEIDDDKSMYYFAIRAKEDSRLIGKAVVEDIEWTNGNCGIHLGIGSVSDRRKGYGTQALRMLLRFVFAEINMYRVTAHVPQYNEAAIALLKRFGFVEEVRRRQALARDGKRWDLFVFGLLKEEWQDQARPVLPVPVPQAQVSEDEG